MRCRHCGKRLKLWKKFAAAEFCSAKHQHLFQQAQGRLGIEALEWSHRNIQGGGEEPAPAGVLKSWHPELVLGETVRSLSPAANPEFSVGQSVISPKFRWQAFDSHLQIARREALTCLRPSAGPDRSFRAQGTLKLEAIRVVCRLPSIRARLTASLPTACDPASVRSEIHLRSTVRRIACEELHPSPSPLRRIVAAKRAPILPEVGTLFPTDSALRVNAQGSKWRLDMAASPASQDLPRLPIIGNLKLSPLPVRGIEAMGEGSAVALEPCAPLRPTTQQSVAPGVPCGPVLRMKFPRPVSALRRLAGEQHLAGERYLLSFPGPKIRPAGKRDRPKRIEVAPAVLLPSAKNRPQPRELSFPKARPDPQARPAAPAGRWRAAAASAGIFAVIFAAGLLASMHGNSADDDKGNSLLRSITSRAATEISEDFSQGLLAWQGSPGWSQTWSYDEHGGVRPGALALLEPTLSMRDYRLEWSGAVDGGVLGWVVRASSSQNYYAMRLVQLRTGPVPAFGVVHYPVIDGREGVKKQVQLSLPVTTGSTLNVAVDVKGSRFVLYVRDKVVDSWSETRLKSGGIGFFSDSRERARLFNARLSHQTDPIGWFCRMLADGLRL